ncbi:MAG: hypothetical protein A2W91_04930 [Bacteroidetes bacterium GWF2_38_335]|nr:MAG: hypothetical protein A2W91_04930 [Bacteroidetes bacterium GWF2_38_335]OFY79825.1 MAG: hypothetical protein A2281_10490 [Bacteroidetes bacterium RIFOXYA12_FULL_38_20]
MRKKLEFFIIGITLFQLSIQAQTTFGDQNVIVENGAIILPYATVSVDLDNDGDMDVLSASYYENKIAWYENTDGNGNFGSQNIISIAANGAYSVCSADLDGDGDKDVLSASRFDNKIAWYENTDGNGTFGDQKVITINADGASSVCSVDIDGDGDMDVLSASYNDNKIAWYENTDGSGTFGPQNVITTFTIQALSVYSDDLDGDGDMDVLSASKEDHKIAWYENIDGFGTFGSQNVITTSLSDAYSVYSADLDGDGDKDVLSASWSGSNIGWYENLDGNGTFSTQQIISTAAVGATSVYSADVDGDGDMDVLSASSADSKFAWYENTDGNGTFGSQNVIATSVSVAMSIFCSDIDSDGDLDVISASTLNDNISWYENTDGNGIFGIEHIITIIIDGARCVHSADIDGDGDMDMLSASVNDNKIAWYENTNGDGAFGPQKVITTSVNGVCSIYCTDLDGDGDIDILSASSDDDKIAWYENIDGNGSYSIQQVITSVANGAQCVSSADLDGDGDMDVLSASKDDDKIAWFENIDGYGTFSFQQIISTAANSPRSVNCADLDGDGDLDVISASYQDDKIAWYENTDGFGTFGTQNVVTTLADAAHSINSADLDGDGDIDLLSASYYDDKIAWYENVDGNGTFGVQQIISTLADYAVSIFPADLDGDGDMDVLSASKGDDKIAWYENTDGNGAFGPQQAITTIADFAMSVYSADIDGDGDMDVLSASVDDDKIAWYENLLVTGIETIQQNSISIYPNPTNGEFTIKTNEMQRIDIFNLNGQLINQTEAMKDEMKIDLNGNSKGIYTVKVITSKGTSVHKVVVE